jgi:hypothetical protein
MNTRDLRRLRLRHQQLVASPARTPAEVVAALGAMQAQDYLGALWSIGARLPGSTEADIERGIAERTLVRSWPMRGTLHFVAAADLRWMLALLTPRVIAGAAAREKREHALDERVFARCRKIVARALGGGGRLTREELQRALEGAGIATGGQRGYHILWRLAQEGLICFGPRAGKQHTFVLLDEWLPAAANARAFDREAALAALAARYFRGHGPATAPDFAWWSGLTLTDARRAIASLGAELTSLTIDGTEYWTPRAAPAAPKSSASVAVHLLPGFDEYLLGYTDRRAALAAGHEDKIQPSKNGLFLATIVLEGRVAGTWKRELHRDRVALTCTPFASWPQRYAAALARAARRYGEFLGRECEVSLRR